MGAVEVDSDGKREPMNVRFRILRALPDAVFDELAQPGR